MRIEGTLANLKEVYWKTSETAVIVGCGPSAKRYVVEKRHTSIGVTSCELLSDSILDLLLVSDRPVRFHERAGQDSVLPFERVCSIAGTFAHAFVVPDDERLVEWRRLFRAVRNTSTSLISFSLGEDAGTSKSDSRHLHYSKTSVYPAVLLAELLGAKRIGLVGVEMKEHPNLNWRLELLRDHFAALSSALFERGVELFSLTPDSALNDTLQLTTQEKL